MKLTVRQADKPHDANQLHDELIAAKVVPLLVESDDAETRLEFGEGVKEADVRKVVGGHVRRERPASQDLAALIDDYEQETNAAQGRKKLAAILRLLKR